MTWEVNSYLTKEEKEEIERDQLKDLIETEGVKKCSCGALVVIAEGSVFLEYRHENRKIS